MKITPTWKVLPTFSWNFPQAKITTFTVFLIIADTSVSIQDHKLQRSRHVTFTKIIWKRSISWREFHKSEKFTHMRVKKNDLQIFPKCLKKIFTDDVKISKIWNFNTCLYSIQKKNAMPCSFNLVSRTRSPPDTWSNFMVPWIFSTYLTWPVQLLKYHYIRSSKF